MKAKWILVLVLAMVLLASACSKQPAQKSSQPETKKVTEAPAMQKAPEAEPAVGLEPPAPSPDKETQPMKLEGDEPLGEMPEEDEPSGEDPF